MGSLARAEKRVTPGRTNQESNAWAHSTGRPLRRLLRGSEQSILRSAPTRKQVAYPSEVNGGAGGGAESHTAPPRLVRKQRDLNELDSSFEEPAIQKTPSSALQAKTRQAGGSRGFEKGGAGPGSGTVSQRKRCRQVLDFSGDQAAPVSKGPSARKRDRSRHKHTVKTTDPSTETEPPAIQLADDSSLAAEQDVDERVTNDETSEGLSEPSESTEAGAAQPSLREDTQKEGGLPSSGKLPKPAGGSPVTKSSPVVKVEAPLAPAWQV